MSELVQQVAAKAIIVDAKGRVLVVREADTEGRSKVGQYGIVGGRVEKGETFLEALTREVQEEVGLKIKPLQPIYLGEWHPVIKSVEHQIIAIFMVCEAVTTKVTLSTENDDYKWIDPTDYKACPVMTPDCYAIDAYAKQAKRK
jgi:8-oxo-dGTP pyrophosphatase MutT (NUDIX family)